MPALVTAAPPITNPIINNTPIFIRCNGYVQYTQKELTPNLPISLLHLQHYISNNLTINMSTAPVTNDLSHVVTPREGFNIVEHPMWKDYSSDEDDEHDEHELVDMDDIHEIDTSDDEYQPLTLDDLNTDEQPQPLTMAGIDTDEQPQTPLAQLDISGIDATDTTHVIDLQSVFDDEFDADIIDPVLTDDSDFEQDYEDDEEEEEYAQRDDIEDDPDYIDFMNMKRIMQNQQVVTKPTWRHRRELVEYGLFKCTCEHSTDIHEEDIDVAADCKDECFTEPEGLFAIAVMHNAVGDTYCRHRKQIEAEPAYEMAIALSPYNAPCYLDYAQIQETCHDDVDKAEQAYVKAIDIHENVLAMYNLASLHLRARGFLDEGEIEHEHLDKAIHYYAMACDWGDSTSSNMACMLLYKNYPEKVEEFAYRFSRMGINKNRCNATGRIFANFLEEIGAINLYERLKAAHAGQYTTQCLAEISSHRDVSPYITKVALFTRLNHVTECGICYDEKLNIDLQCGHTTCTDCYKRVYMNECPFCRFEFD